MIRMLHSMIGCVIYAYSYKGGVSDDVAHIPGAMRTVVPSGFMSLPSTLMVTSPGPPGPSGSTKVKVSLPPTGVAA